MIDTIIELHSAYGRKYANQKSFKEDFNAGKDFNTERGYCSIRDIPNLIMKGILTCYFNNGYSIVYVIRHGVIQNWVSNKIGK